ncbi:MAG: hypothetical protein ACK4YD_05655 [Chitinophagia bacterium]|jgi:uncharacterized Fe-S center protein
MPRTEIEKELSGYLSESDFDFIPHGRISLQDIYNAVQNQSPHLCNDEFLCIDCCSNGDNSPEWKHVVRSVLSRLKDNNYSRVTKIENENGYWHFGEIIEL